MRSPLRIYDVWNFPLPQISGNYVESDRRKSQTLAVQRGIGKLLSPGSTLPNKTQDKLNEKRAVKDGRDEETLSRGAKRFVADVSSLSRELCLHKYKWDRPASVGLIGSGSNMGTNQLLKPVAKSNRHDPNLSSSEALLDLRAALPEGPPRGSLQGVFRLSCSYCYLIPATVS